MTPRSSSNPQDTATIRWSQKRTLEHIREYADTTVTMQVPFGAHEEGPGIYRWWAETTLDHQNPQATPWLEWDDDGGRLLHLSPDGHGALRLPVFEASGISLELSLLKSHWYHVLDAIGADEEAMVGLLNDETASDALDDATHLVVVNRVDRNPELAGIPHVALACLDQVLNIVAPPVTAVYACEPYPVAADELTRERVNHTRVLPDWLTRYWADAGFTRAADTTVWYRTSDSPQPHATLRALDVFGLLPEPD